MAPRWPALASPTKSQFFFLWKAFHNKKNWLFFGGAEAGERSAILYTIVEACRRQGINPFSYLRDVFTRLPSMTTGQIASITPANWAKAHRATVASIAA